MADPYIGEIRMIAGFFAPVGWNFCDGQLVSIADNSALFNLIGTTYGGDGQTTFALPDLRGRLPVHQGSGASSTFVLGQTGGAEEITLTTQQLPQHTHPLLASSSIGSLPTGQSNVLAKTTNIDLYSGDPPNTGLSPNSITSSGGSQPHANFQPYLCVFFIIAMFGIYPSQT